MASTSMRFEDKFDGASKLIYSKSRVTLALQEYDLWELVKNVFAPPSNPQDLAVH
jgi:hypothetical protein